jgi:hypothetical protein
LFELEVEDGPRFSDVRVSGVCSFATSTTRCCGDGGAKLHGWFFPNSSSLGDVLIRTKVLPSVVWLAATAPAGVVHLFGGVAKGSTSPLLSWSRLLSSGESLDPELDRHNGGVIDVVTLLGALCSKT